MKFNKVEKIIKKTELECRVDEITLLSIEEYEQHKPVIPCIDDFWWLRSPGYFSYNAAGVFDYGTVYDFGVYDTTIGVRPALHISVLDSSEFSKGGSIEIFDKTWTVLDVKEDQIYVLADEIIAQRGFDKESNNWETSELKVWLQEWLKEQQKEYDKDEIEKEEAEYE